MEVIKRNNLQRAVFMLSLLLITFMGCSPFSEDGITNPDSIAKKGYFYIADRGLNSLIMLDAGMAELKRWPLNSIAPDTAALQGITFADKNVWLAFSGNEKFIVQLDASGDNLVILHKIPVPPVVGSSTQGTVRGIAYDGQYLWVVNSGSTTYTLSPTLYKVDLAKDSTIASYPIPTPAPRGITYANLALDTYGKGAGAGLYFLDNTTKKVHYFNNKSPLFGTTFDAPIPPAGTTYDQTLGISNDGNNFFTLSYSDIGSYLFTADYNGRVQNSYKLPYKYPVSVVWASYDVRKVIPPVVNYIFPSLGAKGASLSVKISGTGFKNGTGLSVNMGQGITIDTLNYLSNTSLYAHLIIDKSASLGKRNVIITNPDGQKATGDSLFTVTATPLKEYLFVTDVTYDSLFQIRLSDSVIVQSWSTKSVSPSHPHGLAYDGTNLWMAFNSTDYKIIKIDMTGSTLLGLTTFSCPALTGTVQNLTYYNGSLWLLQTPPAAPSVGLIYKLDPETGKVRDSIFTPGVLGGRGLAFANGLLYCNDRDSAKIYSCNPDVKKWSYAFASPAPPVGTTSATGMFFTGTNFWIVNSGGTSAGSDLMYEVSPSGNVIRYITAPYSGAAKPNGIVYITK